MESIKGRTPNTIVTHPTALPNRIIDEVNGLHDRLEHHARLGLSVAIELGQKLAEVKTALPHGEFTAWIKTNCMFSPRNARRFIRVAEHAHLLESKTDDSSVLSLDGALRLISTREDTDRLERLGRKIQRGQRMSWQTLRALKHVEDEKLYTAAGFDNFETWCSARYGCTADELRGRMLLVIGGQPCDTADAHQHHLRLAQIIDGDPELSSLDVQIRGGEAEAEQYAHTPDDPRGVEIEDHLNAAHCRLMHAAHAALNRQYAGESYRAETESEVPA